MKSEKHHRYVSRYGPSFRPDPPVAQTIAAADHEGRPMRAAGIVPPVLPTGRVLASASEVAASPRR